MQAEAFLLQEVKAKLQEYCNFVCKYVDFHRKSQILKQKNVYFQAYLIQKSNLEELLSY